ncbi:MAG: methyltransferase domain-containing protein [Mariniphaga sp.]|nr:methyltransferase domain-containing protein [Mariniphaga sp.]
MNNQKVLSPYANHFEKSNGELQSQKDLKSIVSFIGEKNDFGAVLDIGELNPLSDKISMKYNIAIEQTSIDLDVGKLDGNYDTVFCFEVIEHLFNPLNLLLEINKVLSNQGTLYLSTPKRRPHFMWYKFHFHEFSNIELKNLIKRAGYKIIRQEYSMSGRPLMKYFTGVRQILRLFLERKCLLELKKY